MFFQVKTRLKRFAAKHPGGQRCVRRTGLEIITLHCKQKKIQSIIKWASSVSDV
jgi:hypothetical protein